MSHKRNAEYKTDKDEWGTPDNIFKPLHKEFNFQLDAAASALNAKLPTYFDKEMDALNRDWGRKSVYLNPPYSQGNIEKFMEKAYLEGNRRENQEYVVCLVPTASDTRWWHDWVMRAKEIRFIKGRVKFIGYDECGNIIKNSPTFSSCIVVFSGWHEHYWNQDRYHNQPFLPPIIGNTIYQRKEDDRNFIYHMGKTRIVPNDAERE